MGKNKSSASLFAIMGERVLATCGRIVYVANCRVKGRAWEMLAGYDSEGGTKGAQLKISLVLQA